MKIYITQKNAEFENGKVQKMINEQQEFEVIWKRYTVVLEKKDTFKQTSILIKTIWIYLNRW